MISPFVFGGRRSVVSLALDDDDWREDDSLKVSERSLSVRSGVAWCDVVNSLSILLTYKLVNKLL